MKLTKDTMNESVPSLNDTRKKLDQHFYDLFVNGEDESERTFSMYMTNYTTSIDNTN